MEALHSEAALRVDKLHWVRQILHRRRMEGLPFYRGQMPMLEYISKYPGCTQVELSRALLISPSSVAQSTKRMQRDGLLQKREEEGNQRIKRLFLTNKGIDMMLHCRESLDGVDDEVFASLSEEELRQLNEILLKLLRRAGEIAALDAEHMDILEFMQLKRKWYCAKERGKEGR